LVLVVALVAATVLLAAVTPRLVERTADDAVQVAVAAAGQRAEVVIDAPFEGPAVRSALDPRSAAFVADGAEALTSTLEPPLADVLAAPVATVATPTFRLTIPGGSPGTSSLRLVHLWRGGPATDAVTWAAGRAPEALVADTAVRPGDTVPVEVALSADAAELLGVGPGDRLDASDASTPLDVRVSGVFRADDPDDPVWSHARDVLTPRRGTVAGDPRLHVAALLSDASLPAGRLVVTTGTTTRTYTCAVVASRMRHRELDVIAAQVSALEARSSARPAAGSAASTTSGLDDVLRDVRSRVGAASAQASVVLAGVVAVAATALLLGAQLLVRRRATALAHRRARGGTLAGTAVELAVESVTVAALGGALGLLAADALVPGPVPWAWVVLVLVVAVTAGPAAGVLAAARATGGKRVHADRHQRRFVDRDRLLRRVALDGGVVLAAVGALAAMRVRGVTASGTGTGSDPLLSAAPTLALLAGGLVALRALPPALRWALRRASASRWTVPVLAAARAHATAGRGLPFIALALAAGLVTLGGAVASTVVAGQVDASWSAVGGDVAVVADPDPGLAAVAERVEDAPGVDLAVTARVEPATQLRTDAGSERVRVVVVDAAQLERLLATTPLGQGVRAGLGEASSTSRSGAGDVGRGAPADDPASADPRPVRALLSPDLLAAGTDRLAVLWNDRWVALDGVGEAPVIGADPSGVAAARSRAEPAVPPTVVVDASGLAEVTGGTVDPNRLWVVGPGAREAVGSAPELVQAAVTSRAAWLATLRAAPLTAGLERLVGASTVILLLLAVLLVVLAASASAPDRAATLAMLRTLGLHARDGRRVTVGELLPPVLVASAVGIGLGALVAGLVTRPLALRWVTGQVDDPALVVPWWSAAPVPVLALTVVVTALVESSSRRHERLGQVLRVGSP
jgi:putative ABC transport system permease protein